MDSIHYTLASLSDLPAMEKVGEQLFDFSIKPERAKEFFADPRHHLFLAFNNDQVMGMASGFHYVHPDKNPILFVNEVAVLEEYQNRGIGRQLVKLLCGYGKDIGCKEAWVATMENNTTARRAFVAAGGVEEKEKVVLINLDLEL